MEALLENKIDAINQKLSFVLSILTINIEKINDEDIDHAIKKNEALEEAIHAEKEILLQDTKSLISEMGDDFLTIYIDKIITQITECDNEDIIFDEIDIESVQSASEESIKIELEKRKEEDYYKILTEKIEEIRNAV
jgi:hypothetical protein